MIFLGLDLSYSSTGWWSVNTEDPADIYGGSVSFKAKEPQRLADAQRWIEETLHHIQPDVAVIEGYAMGRNSARNSMGELGGIIRLGLFHYGIGYYVLAPSSLKKFVLGDENKRGEDTKWHVTQKIKARWGYDHGLQDDEADAHALCRAGIAAWGLADDADHEYVSQKARWFDPPKI